jgi:hypothetical protein
VGLGPYSAETIGLSGFETCSRLDDSEVNDHDDRIAHLFMKTDLNSHPQAARIAGESARFDFECTLNIPPEALRFLRKANQSRSQSRSPPRNAPHRYRSP